MNTWVILLPLDVALCASSKCCKLILGGKLTGGFKESHKNFKHDYCQMFLKVNSVSLFSRRRSTKAFLISCLTSHF